MVDGQWAHWLLVSNTDFQGGLGLLIVAPMKAKAQALTPKAEDLILKLAASIRGKRGGAVKNKKRAAASAKNGCLGGRPRKLQAA